ncbi:MAG: hypothetical protein DWP97_05050 [Calditrichaeota bacterium]|nr:MAG: hypothetical protein DWP97_05050 [Calditrichota bacterium]
MKRFTVLVLSIFCCIALITSSVSAKKAEKDEVGKKGTVNKTADNAENKSAAKSSKSKPVIQEKTEKETPMKENILTVNEIIKETGKTATSSSAAGEQIDWQVISSGGNRGTSTNFILSGTIGQTAVGLGSSTNYMVNSGFWQNFAASTGCCIGIRGNVDNDGADAIDIADLVYLVSYSFGGGPAPVCTEEADVDASGGIDIADIVYLVSYSFGGGPAPLPC